ncbi:hypothetical protein HY635_01915 [Candidatus Uhrbacteria bacterium]|nr:hypothetical protein [Candidatus Uhrbacteria bacterium]
MLLALIILGGLVATSFTVGTIVVTRLRGVKAIDDSVLASYAAESAVEDLLYAIRKREQRTGLDASETLPNGATWTRTVEATTQELFLDLAADGAQQLDLFNPSGDLTPINVHTLLLTASAPSPDAWLEVSWTPWLGTGTWSPLGGRALFSPEELQSRKTVDLTAPQFGSTPVAYRVRVRSFSGSVGRLHVTARDANDGTVAFPSRIRATVVGTMGSARYATRVELPSSFPLAPVFDYVLFSECDIVKGGAINCPTGN